MKRKPSWFDVLRWAATSVCGLLLLNFSAPVWAVQNKPVAVDAAHVSKKPAIKKPAKPAAAGKKIIKKPVVKTSQRSPVVIPASVGLAEMRVADELGLHGSASFYGHGFQGRRSATGERFDVRAFTAASNHFPLGSWVAVSRLDNERCAIVKVNDRMARHRHRVIDVSRGVAEYLGMIRAGVVLVRVAPISSANRAAKNCQAAFEVAEDCESCTPPAVSHQLKAEPDFQVP